MRLAALLLCLLGPAASAEQIVLGLNRDQVSITATFDGDDLVVYGAISRDAPQPPDTHLGVIVTVSGPSLPVMVRRKARRLGIWVNADAVEVDAAPSFYAVATTEPLAFILDDVEDLRHDISIPRAIRSVGAPMDIADSATFTQALIRIRAAQRLYQTLEGAVDLTDDTLFRAEIRLPANLIEGDYLTRIFLTRNGKVVDQYQTIIPVEKVGLERWLYNLSRQRPLAYGVMSLAIAIAAGWAASAAFRALRS